MSRLFVWRPLCLLAALATVPWLPGCVTEGEGTRRPVLDCPWPEDGAPADLCQLADDLETFMHLMDGVPPMQLAQLDQCEPTRGHQYAKRAFVYHPKGVGTLRDGWQILLVDDQVRVPAKLWCLLKPPVQVKGQPALRPALVSVAELQDAAMRAGSKQ